MKNNYGSAIFCQSQRRTKSENSGYYYYGLDGIFFWLQVRMDVDIDNALRVKILLLTSAPSLDKL